MRRIVEVRYMGRLGNQLFEYAFGRLLAEHLGATFVAPPIAGFPRARARRASWVMRRSRPSVTIKNHWLGPEDRAALKSERYIELRGYFQRVEYYREHRERIADWFYRPRQSPLPERSLTIHLRSGDVWNGGEEVPHPGYPALPISYYRRILDERPWSAVYLVCEHADDPIATQLLAIPGVIHEERSYLDDFDFLLASRNIALSVSSFGWWPAWLSHAETIFYPLAGIFDPGWVGQKRRSIDLAPRGDARYRFVTVATPTAWRGDAEDRERILST